MYMYVKGVPGWCQICLYSALYCRFAFLNLYCGWTKNITTLKFVYVLGNMWEIKFRESSSKNHVIHKVNIMDAVDKHAPTMTRVVTVRPKTPWHTQQLSDAKRDLRRAESRWRNSKLVVHREIFTSCRNDYRRRLIATKAEYYCTMVDEAGRNMKKLFDVTNTLLGRTTPTQFPCSTDGVPLPECFNTFFVDKISRIICRIDARAEPTVTEYQAPRLHGEDTLYQFTESTVADIKHIIVHSTSKTCALDPVPTSILKDNAEIFAPMIMQIVNASLQSGTVPADMKHALVTPLHKRHGLDSNNFANYRPVSNIGFVSKVLERYVANAVREHVDNNGYNDAFQSAYRPQHSTETALVRIHNDMMQSMDCRRGVLLVLLDLSAAFDTLDHGILLKRLHDIGVRHTALEWFKSYLDDRTFTVKIGQTDILLVVKFDAVSHRAQFSGPCSSMYTVYLSGIYLQSTMSAITFTLTTINCMLNAHRTIIRTRRDKLQNV